MSFVSSSLIVFAIMGLVLMRGPYWGLLVLIGITPMGMMAAMNLPAVGGTSVLAPDLTVVTLMVLMLMRRDVWRDIIAVFAPGGPALPLLFFLAYSIVATIFFPRIFEGATEVFSLSRAANEDGIVSLPLRPSAGNLSQLFRMMLSLSGFLVAAVLIRRRPDAKLILRAMQFATGLHVGMGVLDVLTNAAGLSWLLQPIRTANYSLTLGQKMAGLNRMIGAFPEASSFGYYALGMFGFWLSYWFSDQGQKHHASLFVALSAFAVLRSTSSSAYVGAAAFCLVFLLLRAKDGNGEMRLRTASIFVGVLAAIPIAILGIFMLYALVPAVTDFIDRSLLDKLESDSGVERMSWNLQAFRNFLDTNLLGAGLGSVRASNWLLAALGSLGIPGTLAYLLFLWRTFTLPTSHLDPQSAAVTVALKTACLAFVLRLLVVAGTPNMGIIFCVLAGLAYGFSAGGFSPFPANRTIPDRRHA